MAFPKPSEAVRAIERRGALLVYPLDNREEPRSLWSEFFPRSRMRWEWDSGGDDRVSRMWLLREELSRSQKVVYAKWFRGRATFFSKSVFSDLLATLVPEEGQNLPLSEDARRILEVLEMDSPLSTKQLKKSTELQGKFHEGLYTRATKELWDRLLIVGYGELDDGAFPSLLMGATRLLFEDLWRESRALDPKEAAVRLQAKLGEESPFFRFWRKLV